MPCYVEPPMIQGHEFVGEVIKLGPGIIMHIRIIQQYMYILCSVLKHNCTCIFLSM